MNTSAAVQAVWPNEIDPGNVIDLADALGREQADNAGSPLVEPTSPKPDEGYLNDAELLGSPLVDGLDAFIKGEATFLLGEMWGTRDRRNTQDAEWKPITMPWADWIVGGDATKNDAPWGFTRHPVGKDKAGACIVLGSSIGKARTAKSMEYMHALGLDIDSGAKLNDVLKIIEDQGHFVIVYTSYNHGKCGLQLKRDEVLRKLKIKADPTLEQVKTYLREHDKNRYEEWFIEAVTIKTAKKQVKTGVVIELDTPPLEKFRLIFPLAQPVKIIDLAETHDAALNVWEDKVTGLARNVLGIHFDTSATDPSRLFYTARHAKDAEDWYCAVIQGNPIDFTTIPPMKKALYTQNRAGDVNPFTLAGGGDKPALAYTPLGASLNDWHSTYKDRFMMANLLEDYCADRIRNAGGEAEGQVHIECPFEHEHTSEGGTGCDARNSVDSTSTYWTWGCHHDACQGRHKLAFLEEALRAGWFDESILFDMDSGYILKGEDDEEEVIEIENPANGGKVSATALRKRFRKMIRNGAEKLDAIREAVVESGFNKTDVGKLWTEAADEVAQSERKAEAEKRQGAKPPEFVPLEDATKRTVEIAAENARWLPFFARYRNGWFEAQSQKDPESGWTRICRAFEVPFIAFGETADGRTTEITIRYQHRSAHRGIVESVYQIGDAFKESGSILSRLADEGLEFDGMADVATLVRLFRSVNTSNEAVLVEKAGWRGDVFIAPTGAVVNAGSQRFILNPTVRVSGQTRGTLAEHHAFATTALAGTNGRYLLPGYLSGLVGCVVDYIGNEVSLVLAHEGQSTRGKSSAAKAGAAHWSIPNDTGLFRKGDSTANAVENLAVKANGAVLALDEEGSSKVTAEEKQRLILQWADGSGRSRATAEGGTRETRTWRTCFVTSAEVGFINRMAAEDTDVKTGAVARVFSVNYDGAAELDPAGDELAAIRALANFEDSGVYGVSGVVFAKTLARIGRDVVRTRVSEFEAEWSELAKGAGNRVVRAAAIFAVAGKIAQEAGLFGVQVDVREMMRGLLVDTLGARTVHLDTDRQAIDGLRRAVLKAIQTGDIVSAHEERPFNRQEILGYFGHYADNGKPDQARKAELDKNVTDAYAGKGDTDAAEEAEMQARTYVLPVARLGKLGILTDHKSLGDRLNKAGALIERNKGDRVQWWHTHVPGEGGDIRNLRVTGAFIHGDKEDEEDEAC